jgi:hypothetical protein
MRASDGESSLSRLQMESAPYSGFRWRVLPIRASDGQCSHRTFNTLIFGLFGHFHKEVNLEMIPNLSWRAVEI